MRKLAIALLLVAATASLAFARPRRDADGRCDLVLYVSGESSYSDGCYYDGDGETLRSRYGRNFLFVRRSGQAWVIRDAAALRTAEEIFRPQVELGRKQSALGQEQSRLGREQSRLGQQQAALGREQARIALDGDTADQRDLVRRQEELSRKQDELGRQQSALGRQQDALGRQQEALSKQAEKKIDALIEEAIASGKAERR
jgi:bla regulator protein BlaR1